MPLVGRLDERRALDRVLAAAREGLSGALVVRGEPGIGKTSLLEHVIASAPDFQLARIAGVETEMESGYAGLHRLLLPFVDRLDALPAAQRDAARCAFGLTDGAPADRHLVGVAALSLLAGLAAERPVLCVVDDAHWLDRESLDALSLVGRRLFADRIALVFGAREPRRDSPILQGIPELTVRGLGSDDAFELLRSVVGGSLDEDAARRIVRATHGSPMAIIELAADLGPDERSARAHPPDPLPIGRRLEAHFLRKVRAMPPATQTLLLVAAADPSGDPQVVGDAAGALGSAADASEPARAAGIFEMDSVARFRHPLIRSSVYGGASSAERRRAHEALAAVTNGERDHDVWAWHRAAAAAGPSEEVAADLARAARRAAARGGHSAAGTFLARAAELSVDRAGRAERVLAAAEAHLAGGAPARARSLLDAAAAELVEPLLVARAQRLDGAIRYAIGDAQGTASILVSAARALEPFDLRTARATMLQALAAARVTGRFTARGESEVDVAAAARAMPLRGATPSVADLLLDADVALFLDGHAAAVPLLRRAIDALQRNDLNTDDDLLWLGIGCWAAGAVGDDDALYRLASRLERRAREQGALVALSIGLMFLAMSELLDGSLSAARLHFAERSHLMVAIGRPADVGELVMLAWAGREAEARAEAETVARYATERSHGWMMPFVEYSLGVLELGLGNYRAAYDRSTKVYDENPFLSVVAFPNLVEAAARCGEDAAAHEAIAQLAERALPNGTPLALGLLARSQALVADEAVADDLYQEAIEHLRHCRGDLQLARTHLVYGEWLRRRKRRLDAREQLRAAHTMLSGMGAAGLARRAGAELAATGERVRKRTRDAATELTPQEALIAQLASRGATNPEIAAKLFLSAATVDYHLRKVYRKLAIGSRRDLAGVLARLDLPA